jgi:hypothetical protein
MRLLPVVLTLAAWHVAAAASATSAEQRVYVTIADAKGTPIRGLTAADFSIQIDDAKQTIVSVTPAAEPASVLILTDRLGQTSDYRPSDLQRAVRSFSARLRDGGADPRFALTTFEGVVVQAAKFGDAGADLQKILGRLTPVTSAPLVEALTDACRTVRFAPTPRRVILLLFAAYRPDEGQTRVDVASEMCRLSGASLWTLEARASDGRNLRNPAREMAVDRISQWSGGMHELVTTARALDATAAIMANLIAAQYVITYTPGGGHDQSRLTVGVGVRDAFVLAPMWASRGGT